MMTMGLFGIVINVGAVHGRGVGHRHLPQVPLHDRTAGRRPALTFDVIGIALIASIVLGILTAIVGMVVKD